jgi:hypothetical protein
MVHEIKRYDCPMETIITDFGYKEPEKVNVYNYWDAKPVIETDNDRVKWIVIERPDLQESIIVLCSWLPELKEVKIKFNENFPQKAPSELRDFETGNVPQKSNGGWDIKLTPPYGIKIIKVKK